MTGIFAILKFRALENSLNRKLIKLSSKLGHRGIKDKTHVDNFPVELIVYHDDDDKNKDLYFLEDDLSKPFIAIDGKIESSGKDNVEIQRKNKKSRSNILGYILKKFKSKKTPLLEEVNGSFSGVMYDGRQLIGFKDPVGAKPLYYCKNEDFLIFSSEMKALAPLQENVLPISPGTFINSTGSVDRFYSYPEFVSNYEMNSEYVRKLTFELKSRVINAVKSNINENEKISGLLSGGIDSTIITHIAKDIIPDYTVYTVGIEDSQDLYYAKKYATTHGLRHEILEITFKDLLGILPEVIYALETYDAALIRSSMPMYLIAKKINAIDDAEVLLTGEGGDELFGGYEYLTEIQTEKEVKHELIDLLKVEHKTGLQRVDRIPYHFSIEARAPLFARSLVELSFKVPNELKICKRNDSTIKKWILRKAFENDISDEYLWRKKQKFSDGAGSQFLIRNYAENVISDSEFEAEKNIAPQVTLRSKEELYYWRIFDSKFNPTSLTIENLGITSKFKI